MIQLFLDKVETERLILRPICLDDAEDLYEIGSNDECIRWLEYPKYKSIDDAIWSIQNVFMPRVGNGLPEAYAIVLKENNKMIGTCDFVKIKDQTTGELGYQLNRDYWQKGYMSEAVKKVIEVGFTHIGFRRIEIRHSVLNKRSERVIQKAGFVYEGLGRKEIYDKEKKDFVDVKHYSILKEEWEIEK